MYPEGYETMTLEQIEAIEDYWDKLSDITPVCSYGLGSSALIRYEEI